MSCTGAKRPLNRQLAVLVTYTGKLKLHTVRWRIGDVTDQKEDSRFDSYPDCVYLSVDLVALNRLTAWKDKQYCDMM